VNQPATLSRQGGIAALALLMAGLIGVLAAAHGVLALAAPVLIAGGTLLLIYPVWGLFLVVGTLPLESALMVGGRSVAALIGMGVFAAWAAQKLLRRERLTPLLSPGLVHVALLLFAFGCLSMLWAAYPGHMQRQLILFFQLVLLMVLVLDLGSSWERVAWIGKLLVVAGTLAALLTLEQYFLGGARRAGAGVVGSINRTAVTLVTILPFGFYLFRSRERLFWRLLGLAYIALSAGAVAVTLSRMNFLLFPAVVLINVALMLRSRRGRGGVLLLAGTVAIATMLVPVEVVRGRADSIVPYLSQTVGADDADGTQSARGYRMRVGLQMFKDHPIGGVGFDNYRPQFPNYQWLVPGYVPAGGYQGPTSSHGSHVAFLANLGILGFALWLGLFAVAGRYVWHAVRAAGDAGRNSPLVQAFAIAIGLQFVYGFYSDIHAAKIFWVLLGVCVAVYRLSPRGARTSGPGPGAGDAPAIMGSTLLWHPVTDTVPSHSAGPALPPPASPSRRDSL
jgi:hypothetical protein